MFPLSWNTCGITLSVKTGKASLPWITLKIYSEDFKNNFMKKKIVQVGNIACGADQLFVISGPCVIEDEMIMMKTAEKLKEVAERMKIKIIYKSSFQKDNRSSLNYYDGPGLEKGMKILSKVKEQFGFPLLTDI